MIRTRHASVAVAAVMAAGFLASAAMAQSPGKVMQGVKKASLIVEDINRQAEACGVTAQAIENAFRLKMIGSPILLLEKGAKADPQAAVIYIKASILPIDIPNVPVGPCITNLSTQLLAYQRVTLAASQREVAAGIDLWDNSEMLASSRETHVKVIGDAAGVHAAKLVEAWKLDNQ